MLIANIQIAHGLKSPTFAHRYWEASNGAMWAMSPPENRCFFIQVKNLDYVPLQIKQIKLTTGDEREALVIEPPKGTAEGGEPLKIISVADEHTWAVDAMPLFFDIATTLQAAQAEEWQALREKHFKLLEGATKNEIEKEESKDATAAEEKKKTRWDRFFFAPLRSFKARCWVAPHQKIKASAPLKEVKLWLQAADDVLNEVVPENIFDGTKRAAKTTGRHIVWLWNFFTYLPVFLVRIVWISIKKAGIATGNWLRAPFLKYKLVKHKRFYAIVEFQNGWRLKTKGKVEITYQFIEEQIMPLIFTPEQLRPELELRSEFLDPCLKLLQLPKEAV